MLRPQHRRPVAPLRAYLRANAAAIVAMTVATPVWGFVAGVLVARSLGIRVTEVNNRPATLVEKLRFWGDPGAINSSALLVLLLALVVPFRVRLRAGLLLVALLVVGLPASILSALWMAPIVMENSWRGWPNLVETATAPIGLAAAWVAWLVVMPLLARFRLHVRITRRGRIGHSLCPECRYDLAATTTGVCPECGWTVPAGVRGTGPATEYRAGH